MKKSKKFKTFLYLILLFFFVLCFQTIAYSAINSTLNIKGDAYARVEADVRITNFRLANLTNATSHYEEYAKSHIITEVDLNNTSSQITYYLEITNYGSVDIGIFDITGLPDGVNYSIKDYNLHDKICDDTGKCNSFIKKTYELTLTTTSSYSGQVQLNFDFRTYHKVTYNGITNNNYPIEVIDGGDLSITFEEDLKRVQATSNGAELAYYSSVYNGQTITISNIANDLELKIKPQVAKLMNGSLTEVGSEVCIDEECFYIISNDGTTVSMLAKYNLYVGGSYTGSTWTAYGEEATGKQNSNMLGWTSNSSTWEGLINYSDMTNDSSNYETSVVKNYINNYGSYLQSVGAVYNNIRLITTDELVSLGCDESSNSCSNAKSFVMNTSFWTETAYDSDYVWFAVTDGNYDHYITSDRKDRFGVRPVIEISIDEIRPLLRIESGDLDTVGSELCISDECFYVISSDDNSTTMLAKYNLYVGGEYNNNTKEYIEYGEEETGKQDPAMLGHDANTQLIKGVTEFANEYYWSDISSFPTYVYNSSSTIYKYIERYKSYFTNIGISINEARPIKYDEIKKLGCNLSESCKNNAPSWLYSTTYWSGDANDDAGFMISVWTTGDIPIIDFKYESNNLCGVRPVITIPKWTFAETITFTLDGATYYAKNGMTWKEWGDSKYNTFTKWETPLTFNSTYINLPVGDNYFVCNSSSVSDTVNPSNKIIAGKEYYLESKAK